MTKSARQALALDGVAVCVFVAIGRRNHGETGNAFVGLFRVAAPFLIALLVVWLVGRVWRHPTSLSTGVGVWLATVGLGMVLRNRVFDRGTATSFVIVTAVVLGVLINGWRAVARRMRR